MDIMNPTTITPVVLLATVLGCSRNHVPASRQSESASSPAATEPADRESWLSIQVGMTKEQALACVPEAIAKDQWTEEHRRKGCIIRPADPDLTSDTWTIGMYEPYVGEGGCTIAELTFADGRITRIRIVMELH